MKKLTRRALLTGTAAVAGATIANSMLAGCTKIVKETVVVEKQVEKLVEPTPVRGQINALGVELPLDALPLEEQVVRAGVSPDQGAHGHYMESMYDTAFGAMGASERLTGLDYNYDVIGLGAESWQPSEDMLHWDFALRRELVFSDGTPVTAKDWVFTLQRSLANGYDFGWFYSDIKNSMKVLNGELPKEELGIEAVDDYTLRIYTESPTPYLPAICASFEVAPQQAYAVSETWSLEPENHISSGPWKLVEFKRGVSYRFELNPTYKGVLRPYFTAIEGKTRPAATLATYMAGESTSYSVGPNTPAWEVAMVNSNAILRAETHPMPAGLTKYVMINTVPGKFPPLDNIDVRYALSKSWDKEAVVASIYRGFAYPAYSILPKGFPNSDPERMKARDPNIYDPEAAKQLLSKAGFPEGKGFPTYELWTRDPTEQDLSLCQALQAAWRDVLGINVEIKAVDYPTMAEVAYGVKKGNVPLSYVHYGLDFYDPSTFLNVFKDGSRHPSDDPLFTEMNATANAERDPVKRFELLADAEQQLVDNGAHIWTLQPFEYSLWPCTLRGFDTYNEAGFLFLGGIPWGTNGSSQNQYWSNSDCRDSLVG